MMLLATTRFKCSEKRRLLLSNSTHTHTHTSQSKVACHHRTTNNHIATTICAAQHQNQVMTHLVLCSTGKLNDVNAAFDCRRLIAKETQTIKTGEHSVKQSCKIVNQSNQSFTTYNELLMSQFSVQSMSHSVCC